MKLLPAQFASRLVAAFCFSLVAILTVSASAEEPFEGRVKMKISDGSQEQMIDYFVKGERMRIELEDPRAQGGVMIMNMAEKEVLMLMPQQKMYMTMPIPDIPGETETAEGRKPEPTGETRKILGYDAKQYNFEHDGNRYEIWATDELGAFGNLQVPGEGQPGASSPLSSAFAGQKFFPLLIIETRDGREATRVEVTEVEKKDLEDSLFEAPSDYRGMSLPMGAPQ